MEQNTAILRAVQTLGSQQRLAEALGVYQSFVSKMARTGRVPAERCLAIEMATNGAVTRYELRPDVFGPAPAANSSQEGMHVR